MLYDVFKMFVGRLLLISVLLYNTEAYSDIFNDEYDGPIETASIANATIPIEDKTPTNGTETIYWYYGDKQNNTLYYESVPVEDKSPASDTVTTNRWSYGSNADEKNKTWDSESTPILVDVPPGESDRKANSTDEVAITKPYNNDDRYLTVAHLPKNGYEKENNTKKIDWPFNWLFDTATSTTRTFYSNSSDELENDRNTTETSYYRYNKTVVDSESTRRPYHSNWYHRGRTESVNTTTTRRRHDVNRYHGWWMKGVNTTTIPRNLTTTAPYGYNVGTNDTRYYITSKHVKYNWGASVSPIVNRTNSSDWNVTKKATTDQVNPKSTTSGRNPVNILINSSINANESKINGTFTDFLKKISGYILPSSKYVAPNSNVTNLAVAEGNGNAFFYAYNLIIGS